MTVNLAQPYNALASPPRSTEMTFCAPAQPDFLFAHGKEILISCQPVQRALALTWALSRNGIKHPFRIGNCNSGYDNSFAIAIDTRELRPGFYDLQVDIVLSATDTVSGTTTFGWHVDHEQIPSTCPDDFDAFWQQARDSVKRVPLNLKLELNRTLRGEEVSRYNVEHAALPDRYDVGGEKYHDVEIYKVNFASLHGRVFGWFAKPVGLSHFPGLLVLPGAGNGARPAPVEHARHGFAALDIQVHGYEVDLSEEQYPLLTDGENDCTPECARDYAIYLNALQAVQALQSLPGVDSERIAVAGGSQGGRLAVVVAALEPQVRAAIPAITHYAALPWLRWVAGQNKAGQSGVDGYADSCVSPDSRSRIECYFDVVNFAPLIRCPVLMNAGLIDPVSMPTGVFAVYRAIRSSKKMVPLPNVGHDWSPAFDRYAWKWLHAALEQSSHS